MLPSRIQDLFGQMTKIRIGNIADQHPDAFTSPCPQRARQLIRTVIQFPNRGIDPLPRLIAHPGGFAPRQIIRNKAV